MTQVTTNEYLENAITNLTTETPSGDIQELNLKGRQRYGTEKSKHIYGTSRY